MMVFLMCNSKVMLQAALRKNIFDRALFQTYCLKRQTHKQPGTRQNRCQFYADLLFTPRFITISLEYTPLVHSSLTVSSWPTLCLFQTETILYEGGRHRMPTRGAGKSLFLKKFKENFPLAVYILACCRNSISQ